jgi:tetratricopeptide (TPR) repeat protein
MNIARVKKIVKYLSVPLVLVGIGLAAWNSYMDKAEPVDLDNTKADLAAYRKAVERDPDNADGWNELGRVLLRTGELAQAEEAFRKVLALGEVHQNQDEQTWALGNLGLVYFTRGDLDKAEELYRKVLAIHETLGSKGGMAATYGNLGSVYFTRGDLDKAEDLWKKSLRLFQEIGHPSAKAFRQVLDDLAQQRTTSTQ